MPFGAKVCPLLDYGLKLRFANPRSALSLSFAFQLPPRKTFEMLEASTAMILRSWYCTPGAIWMNLLSPHLKTALPGVSKWRTTCSIRPSLAIPWSAIGAAGPDSRSTVALSKSAPASSLQTTNRLGAPCEKVVEGHLGEDGVVAGGQIKFGDLRRRLSENKVQGRHVPRPVIEASEDSCRRDSYYKFQARRGRARD